jgi:uncharacterized membrane protein YbjE (DUF340 family)
MGVFWRGVESRGNSMSIFIGMSLSSSGFGFYSLAHICNMQAVSRAFGSIGGVLVDFTRL